MREPRSRTFRSPPLRRSRQSTSSSKLRHARLPPLPEGSARVLRAVVRSWAFVATVSIKNRAEKGASQVLSAFVPTLGRKAPASRRRPPRSPQGAVMAPRGSRGPTGEEALDRRMKRDLVELSDFEQPMAPDGNVLRGHGFERPPLEI